MCINRSLFGCSPLNNRLYIKYVPLSIDGNEPSDESDKGNYESLKPHPS